MKKVLQGILVFSITALLFVGAFMIFMPKEDNAAARAEELNQIRRDAFMAEINGDPHGSELAVTLAKYQQIQSGMSYDQVVAITGAPGSKLSENTVDLFPGTLPAVITAMYQWTNGEGGSMTLVFQDNKVVIKSQGGLK